MASLIRTQLEANALLREHGLADRGWTFKWDAAKRRGGACHYQTKDISMSKYLVPKWSDEEVREVLLHEVAHALAGGAAGHGPAWRRIAQSIGSTGQRTHSNETETPKWRAVCPTHGALGAYHRRGKLSCRRCYNRGIVQPLSYVPNLDVAVKTR